MATPKGPAEAPVPLSQGRAEQVRSCVEAYRRPWPRPEFQRRSPQPGTARSTASVYLRKALTW